MWNSIGGNGGTAPVAIKVRPCSLAKSSSTFLIKYDLILILLGLGFTIGAAEALVSPSGV